MASRKITVVALALLVAAGVPAAGPAHGEPEAATSRETPRVALVCRRNEGATAAELCASVLDRARTAAEDAGLSPATFADELVGTRAGLGDWADIADAARAAGAGEAPVLDILVRSATNEALALYGAVALRRLEADVDAPRVVTLDTLPGVVVSLPPDTDLAVFADVLATKAETLLERLSNTR